MNDHAIPLTRNITDSNTSVLTYSGDPVRLKILEALYILQIKPTMNVQDENFDQTLQLFRHCNGHAPPHPSNTHSSSTTSCTVLNSVPSLHGYSLREPKPSSTTEHPPTDTNQTSTLEPSIASTTASCLPPQLPTTLPSHPPTPASDPDATIVATSSLSTPIDHTTTQCIVEYSSDPTIVDISSLFTSTEQTTTQFIVDYSLVSANTSSPNTHISSDIINNHFAS